MYDKRCEFTESWLYEGHIGDELIQNGGKSVEYQNQIILKYQSKQKLTLLTNENSYKNRQSAWSKGKR